MPRAALLVRSWAKYLAWWGVRATGRAEPASGSGEWCGCCCNSRRSPHTWLPLGATNHCWARWPQSVQTYSLRRSQSVPSQPRIVPLSRQIGQCQVIVSPSGSSRAWTVPRHRRRAGLRRQGTFGSSCHPRWWLVTHPTMEPKKSASVRAGPGISSGSTPSSSKKCRKSVTKVSPIGCPSPCSA